jgi:hypothetical protein
MLQRELLANDFAEKILDSVKDNGWLRSVSEDIGINRREFSQEGISNMKLRRVIRILVSLAFHLDPKRWHRLWTYLGSLIYEMEESHYDEFCNERRTRKR